MSVAPQAPQTMKKTRSGLAPQESREDAEAAEEECARRDRAGWMGQESGLRKKKPGRTDRLYSRVQSFVNLIVAPRGQTNNYAALAWIGNEGAIQARNMEILG